MKPIAKLGIAMRLFVIICFCVGIVSCITKKVSKNEHKDNSTVNTVNTLDKSKEVNNETSKTPAVNMGISVANPCDSNGNLKPLQLTQSIGNSKIVYRTKHDTLFIDCNCDSSIRQMRTEKETIQGKYVQLAARYVVDAKRESVTVYKVPFWAWCTMLGLFALACITSYWFFSLLLQKQSWKNYHQ